MKRFLLLSLLTVTFNSIYSQEIKQFSLMGAEYSFEYEKAHNRFTVCTESKSSSSCQKYNLANTDEFRLPEMQKHLKEYFAKIISTITQFDSLELSIDTKSLKSNKKDTLKFTKPIKLSAFHAEFIESDTLFSFKPLNPILEEAGVLEIKFEKDIEEHKNEFLQMVKDSLIVKLKNGKESIEKEFKNVYEREFKDFYKDKVTRTNSYLYLTTEEMTLKNDTVRTSVTWYYLLADDIFHLRVSKSESLNEFKIYGPFEFGISESKFVQKIFDQHQEFKEEETNKVILEKILALVKTPVQEATRIKDKKIQNEMILKVADSLDNITTTYSGQITINKKFKLYPKGKNNKGAPREFIVDSAAISFFNNRAQTIAIKGKIDGKDYISFNNMWSLPLREFNVGRQSKAVFVGKIDEKKYEYYYDDAFDYSPDKKYNYAVQSEEINLTPEKPVSLKERKLMDYFTGIFFSDFLGLNNNNQNGLIIAEAQMHFPLHLRNWGVFTLFDNISFYGSANLFSGFENNSRKIVLPDLLVSNPDEFDETNEPYRFFADNFNLLLNNNIDAGMRVSFGTIEWKGATSFLHFRYGLRFLRTGVEYDIFESSDSENSGELVNTLFDERDFQVFTIGHELETNIEFRPQSNIGADLTVGLNWFGATGTSKNDIKFNTTNNSANLKVMANLYALVNPNSKKSGLFFRLGGHYDLGNYRLFPQMMLGYATNLTSFINRTQSKK